MPWDMIRRGEGSEWVVGAVTSGGGHVGWFVDSEGEKKGQLKRWYGDPIVQFLMGVQAVSLLSYLSSSPVCGTHENSLTLTMLGRFHTFAIASDHTTELGRYNLSS